MVVRCHLRNIPLCLRRQGEGGFRPCFLVAPAQKVGGSFLVFITGLGGGDAGAGAELGFSFRPRKPPDGFGRVGGRGDSGLQVLTLENDPSGRVAALKKRGFKNNHGL